MQVLVPAPRLVVLAPRRQRNQAVMFVLLAVLRNALGLEGGMVSRNRSRFNLQMLRTMRRRPPRLCVVNLPMRQRVATRGSD